MEEQQLPGLEDDSDFQEKLIIKAKAYKAFRYLNLSSQYLFIHSFLSYSK